MYIFTVNGKTKQKHISIKPMTGIPTRIFFFFNFFFLAPDYKQVIDLRTELWALQVGLVKRNQPKNLKRRLEVGGERREDGSWKQGKERVSRKTRRVRRGLGTESWVWCGDVSRDLN